MKLTELLNDKSLSAKDKTAQLAEWTAGGKVTIDEVIGTAAAGKDPVKATCIEAMEFATRLMPEVMTAKGIAFCIASLSEKAPRVKWESAKVIANVIHLFPGKINAAVKALLENTGHKGTVVRWSAATALSAIVRLNGKINKELIPAIEALMKKEEKNSIRKIYHEGLKKSAKP